MSDDFYERIADPKFWENASRIVANTERTPSKPHVPYAFTEIINVTFASPVNLSDASAPESRLWEQTIKTYLDHSGTTKIWFGQLLDAPHVMKLIIGSYRDHTLRNSTFLAMLTKRYTCRLDIGRGTQRLPRLPGIGRPTRSMGRKPNANHHQCTGVLPVQREARISKGILRTARHLR